MERLLLVLLLIFSFNTQAQTTYTYTGTGDWDTTANWSPSYPGTTINAVDTVIISSNATAVNNTTITNLGTIDISGILENQTTGSITNSGTVTIPALGTLANFGTFSSTNATFTNAGTVVNNTNANFEFTDNTPMHSFTNQATLTNHGTFTLALSSSFTHPSTAIITNTGAFNITFFSNRSILFISQGTINNHGALSVMKNRGLVTFNNEGMLLNTNELNLRLYRGTGHFTNEGIATIEGIVLTEDGSMSNTGTIITTNISSCFDCQVFINEGILKVYGGARGYRLNRKIVNNNIIEILPDGIVGLGNNDTFINNGTILNRGILSSIAFDDPVLSTLHNSETGIIDNRGTLVLDLSLFDTPSTLINDGAIINTGTYTNNGVLVNNGTITNSNALNNGGSIAIEAMGTLSTSGTTSNQSTGSITNAGTITTLELGTFTNAGTITMDTTGTLSTSGTTNNQPTGSIINAGTVTTLESGTLSNEGAITINAMATLSTPGTTNNQATGIINNSGTVTIPEIGTLTNFGTFTNTNATITNAGTLVNNTNANFEFTDNTSMHSFTNQATLTNHGTFTLALSSSFTHPSTAIITNTGAFNITFFSNRSILFISQGTINNHGALSVMKNRGLVTFNNEGMLLNTNELNLRLYRGTGHFTNQGIATIEGIDLTEDGSMSNTGTIITKNISSCFDCQVFINEGILKVYGGETGFRFSRKIVNNNIIEILPDGIAGMANDTFINNGTILNKGTLSTIAFGSPVLSTLHNSETGVIDNRGTLVLDLSLFDTPSTLINDGAIINTGTYTNNGVLVNNGTFTNNNIFDNSGTFSNLGILSGSNTIHTQDFTNTGTLSPGNTTASIGTYVLNNNYTHNNVAILDIEIESATEFDVIAVSGVANLSGALNVSLPAGFIPQEGDVFTILTANSISGTFDTLNLPSPNGQIWEVDYNPTNVTIRVPFICDVDVTFTATEGVCVDSGIQSGLGGGSPVVIVESTTVTINISYDVFGFASFVGGNIVFDSSGAMLSTDVTADNGASGSSVNLLNATALGDTITLTFDNGQTPNIVANTVIIGASGAVNFISGTNFTIAGDLLDFVSGIGTVTTEAVGSRIYSGPGVTDDGNGVTYSFDPLTAGIGTHTLTYTYTDINNCTDSARDTIEVFAIDNSVSLVNEVLTANEVGATYQWFECPNILLTDEINQSFTPSASGDYKITITKGGCVVESNCITVTLPTLDVTTFEDAAEFSMFPNPSSENIKIKTSVDSDFKIINMLGYTVKEFKADKSIETTVFIGDLTSGVYFVIPRNSVKIASQKLIVKN